MATYLIESYLANHPSAVEDARTAARRAAEVAPGVRHLRTTFLPRDETVFHLFEAPSEAVIRAAATTASLPIDRITEAVEDPEEEGGARDGQTWREGAGMPDRRQPRVEPDGHRV